MKSFINSWNLFSKARIINSNFVENNIIFTTQENISKLRDVLSFFKKDYSKLECFSQYIDFIYNQNWNYISNYKILQNKNINLYQIENNKSFKISVWEHLFIDDLTKKLNEFWYIYSQYIWDDIIPETSVFNKLWDIVTIKIKNSKNIIKISFFGNEVEAIDAWKKLDFIRFWMVESLDNYDILEWLNDEIVKNFEDKFCILDNIDIYFSALSKQFNNWLSLDLLKKSGETQINLEIKDLYIDNLDKFTQIIKNNEVEIFTTNTQTITNFLEYNNLQAKIEKTNLKFLSSYFYEFKYVICDDIISKIFVKKRVKKSLWDSIDLLLTIKPGDFVVHIEHWIWVFNQIIKKEVWWQTSEYIEIEYKNNDKLFVPIIEVKRISKYIWESSPKLTALSTKEWSKKLEKASADTELIAHELLELYAKRQTQKWFSFAIDKQKAKEFIDSFEFPYTHDQESSVYDILWDMQKEIPMDRVLVWDVWFWKTEIAFNAIFHAFLNKKQSVLISPLVVLAYQHYEKARERFAKFGLKIEILTRYETQESSKRVLEQLKKWEIDLIIWTHKLLWESIIYKNLWLLIVDEEHKFWVLQKEKIKQIATSVDVLSMSATPIPRSLNMALSWIKDISIISTPPEVRKWVETFVSNYSQNIIKEAWLKEFERWWQIFFIHNRVATIDKMWEELTEIFPDKKIIITHGQLDWNDLEDRIMAFKRKEYDILLSSTVIENWVDLPNVNTIFINDAYKFWISQIHQLRWRVWRSDKKGYCYLMFNREKLTPDAAKRLQTVVDYSHLWAWFELAMKDLEIRWWWDILWVKQSWTVVDIWISTYLKMLQEKVSTLKESVLHTEIPKLNEVVIDLNIQVYINDECFASNLDKINFYREIEFIDNIDDLEEMIAWFTEINPNLPEESHNLFKLLKLKIQSSLFKINSIKRNGLSYEICFNNDLSMQELKWFLDLDKRVVLIVKDLHQLKVPVIKFKNDVDFMNYLYEMLFSKNNLDNKKIKIKLKK